VISRIPDTMRSRIAVLAAVAIAAISVAVTAFRVSPAPAPEPPVHTTLKISTASYLGVYEAGAPPSYAPIAGFAKAAGRQPNLAGYFSGWVEPFNTAFADTLRQHGVIPFVQIDPTDASIAAIAAGTYDDYLKLYAESVRDFRHSVVIGFGHEMNASWYSWGYGHVAPATFVAAWRHLVTVFRQQGADNVTWLWCVEAAGPGIGPVRDWWPGAQYVTWIGIDNFFYRPSQTFATVFGHTISQIRSFGKPVLLSETAVGPEAGQFAKIQDLFRGMASANTLGLVWFDLDQHGGSYHQDWRIEDAPIAELSFRLGVRSDLAPLAGTP
jgi:mannan endo-1,4-beta-mannosidase